MDWLALRATLPKNQHLTGGAGERAYSLSCFDRVLDGTQYDEIVHPFSAEKADNGEYVPLTKRRPSVRTNWCRTVVEDSVSMLFSEGHWPPIKAKASVTADLLTKLVKETALNEVMLEAATRGSVGSVAIHVRFIKNRPFFDVLPTAYLTPTWQAEDPRVLATVTELYTVKGADLVSLGYQIPKDKQAETYWFRRVWDDQKERWFVPIQVSSTTAPADMVEDTDRSVPHDLGFVPLIWVRNLPTLKRSGPDGACTFESAIDTVIEADYLLSQGGRALKYASDPTLVLKAGDDDGGDDGEPARKGGAANALNVGITGDAKLLEINGQSSKAVLEHVLQLRAIALEATHGNRTHADRLSAATSGRSIELMMTGLIWLADRLRISYGEGALLSLLRMVCAASAVLEGGVIIDKVERKDIDADGLELRWPAWMPPMPKDLLETGQALVTAVAGGIISQETGAAKFGAALNVDDATDEFEKIQAEYAEKAKQAQDLVLATTARNEANAGLKETRQVTA